MGFKTGSQNAAKAVGRMIKMLLGAVVMFVIGYGFVQWYPYIFSKKVDGVLQQVERVQLNVALMQTTGQANETMNPQLFSFAVAIRQDNGVIETASAEDRQWAAARPGNCVTATYYPYPPWRLDKAGTYYGARLDKQYECPDRLNKAGGLPMIQQNSAPNPTSGQMPPSSAEPAATPSL